MVATLVQYGIPDEQLHAQPPKCFICGKSTWNSESMPWFSEFAEMWLCGECWRKHIDPAVRKAKNGEKE